MPKVGKLDLDTEEEKRKRIPNKVFVYLLLFIPISYVIGYFFLAIYTHFKYKNILADLKARGEPTSLADYEFPEVPNEENSAVYIRAAVDHHFIDFDNYSDTLDGDFRYTSLNHDFKLAELTKTPEKLQIIKDWINTNKITLELIKKGTQCPMSDFRFNYKYKEFWGNDWFWLNGDYFLDELFKYNQYVSIVENDKTQAIENWNLILDYGKCWRNELTFTNYWQIRRMYDLSLEMLHLMLENFEFTCDEIDLLSNNLQKIFNTIDIKKMLEQERSFYLDYIEVIDDDPLWMFRHVYEFDYIYYEIMPINTARLSMLETIKILGQLMKMADKPYPEIGTQLNKMIIKYRESSFSWEFTKEYNFIGDFRTHFDDIALYRIVQTTLAIKKFEILNKRIPKNLDALIEAGLMDQKPKSPFTNRQLIYEVENCKYKLYCPGSKDESTNCYSSDNCLSPCDDIEWKYEDD